MSESNPYPMFVGPRTAQDGVSMGSLRGGRTGEQLISQVHGRYTEQAQRGNVYFAQAIVTAPVIWTTEAGTGGPLLWNPSQSVNLAILAVGYGISVVTTVAASLGLTAGYGQTAAPTSTTAIDSQGCLRVGTSTPQAQAYRVGTTVDNKWFLPFADLNTGALTTRPGNVQWIDIGGMVVVPYQSYVSIAASATATTTVGNFCIIWEEVPV